MIKFTERTTKYLISTAIVLIFVLGPVCSTAFAAVSPTESFYSGYPTFSIINVIKDSSVTINTNNLPPHDEFRVHMGVLGARGVNGIKVTTFRTGKGGTQTLTFNIPETLYGQKKLAIHIESKTGTVNYAYNWFHNNSAGKIGKGGKAGYSGYPTITILSLVRNKSVTFQANNLPPGDQFKVLMNGMGTRGLNGVNVGSFISGAGGRQKYTYSIPDKFPDETRSPFGFRVRQGLVIMAITGSITIRPNR